MLRVAAAWAVLLCAFRTTTAELLPEDLLVVYNSASMGAETILITYLRAHPQIGSEQVLDLKDPRLADRADIGYGEFAELIRRPIREFLMSSARGPEDIRSILLLRGIPHRISDMNRPDLGDDPDAAAREFLEFGNASYASVDSELTLLWQDLERGESGLTMDSYADNVIANPYHGSAEGFDEWSRYNITFPKVLNNADDVAWLNDEAGLTAVTPGDFYLVCRIDGETVGDALALIRRARHLVINRARTVVVLDENDVGLPVDAGANRELDDDSLAEASDGPGLFDAHDDFEMARDALLLDGWNVIYDDTALFLGDADIDATIIAYGSYGSNHGEDGSEVSDMGPAYVLQYDFARGAIFNSIESFNGRGINGLHTMYEQGQLSDFIAVGGTFGIGHVFEPFSFAVPDNEYLLVNFLVNRMSWAEAAWSSIPVLSWQHIVVGDPLARVERVVDLTADLDVDGDVDLVDFATFQVCFTGAGGPAGGSCWIADLDGDGDVDLVDFMYFSVQFTAAIMRQP